MTEKSHSIEEELARKYRQPKGVEQFGVEQIPKEARTVHWWDVFSIVLNFVFNPGTIVIGGAFVAAGMTLWQAMIAGCLSIVIGFSTYLVAATVGVDHGIPGLVSMRTVFGINGAKVASVLRAVSSVFWFAFQTFAAAEGIKAVLDALLDIHANVVWVSLGCAVIQLSIAVFGYGTLKRLSRFAFVFKILFSVVIIYVLITYPASGFHPSEVFSFAGHNPGTWALISLWAVSNGTSWFSNFTDAADFCRYSTNRTGMWFGTFSAAIVGQVICTFIGGYAVAATAGKSENALTTIVQVQDGVVWLLALMLVYLVLDAWIINVQNLYTAGLAITNILSKVGRFWGTLVVGAFGVALATNQNLITGFTGYMNELGKLFAPMAGIFVVHYLVFARGRIEVPELFRRDSRYWYWKGVNWVALAWMVIGYFIDSAVPQQYFNMLVSAAVSGGLYMMTMSIVRRWSRAAELGTATPVISLAETRGRTSTELSVET